MIVSTLRNNCILYTDSAVIMSAKKSSYFCFKMSVIFSYFQKNAEGKELLDKVCQHLDLQERDYFGIQYVDERLPQHLKVTVHNLHFCLIE